MSPNIRGSSLTGVPSRVQRGEERGSPALMHSRVMSLPIFTCTGPSGSTDTVGDPEGGMTFRALGYIRVTVGSGGAGFKHVKAGLAKGEVPWVGVSHLAH